jgi:hypothetical protein
MIENIDPSDAFVNADENCFHLTFGLQMEDDDAAAYVATATFEGNQALNTTAWTYTLDGRRFAACTTIQYGYKPSANSTTITFEPQVSQETMLTKDARTNTKRSWATSILRISLGFS